MPSWYADRADLENALGGGKELRELADPNRTGTADQSIIDGYLEDGAAEVRGKLEVKHDPEVIAQLDAPSLRRLRWANAACSARIAYEKGGQGRAMPEHVTATSARADSFLDELARGLVRLGRVSGGTAAAINQPAGVVDYDENGTGISIAGFKLGFR